LKQTWKHKFGTSWTYVNTPKELQVGAQWNIGMTQNALCQGYTYNRSTGKRTYRPNNVNGNWYTNGGIHFSTPLDKKKRLTLGGNTYTGFNQNVDLIGLEGEGSGEQKKSTVHNLYLQQALNLEYNFGEIVIGAKGNGTWTHATSRREDFSTINAGDYNYGLTLKADLPANFGISTDLTVFSRRGYEDESMNTNDIVWNIRVSKRFFGNRLTVMLDGFDLLHQLSNTYRNINGQGRIETTYIVIPRYLMLHIIYRLNVTPKKK